mgnify:CR=1 FL=1
MSIAKEALTKLVQQQPEDSSSEQIVRELAFHVMIERGLLDSVQGNVVSNEEMRKRIKTWQN